MDTLSSKTLKLGKADRVAHRIEAQLERLKQDFDRGQRDILNHVRSTSNARNSETLKKALQEQSQAKITMASYGRVTTRHKSKTIDRFKINSPAHEKTKLLQLNQVFQKPSLRIQFNPDQINYTQNKNNSPLSRQYNNQISKNQSVTEKINDRQIIKPQTKKTLANLLQSPSSSRTEKQKVHSNK